MKSRAAPVRSVPLATILARAGSAAARVGVRARVGAVEGAAGAVLVEPIVLGATSQEQADYGLMDSFLNVTLGTVMGGALHVGAGGIADAVRRNRPWQTARSVDERGRMIDALPEEARIAAIRTAVAQAVDGRRVDVEPIIAFGRMEAEASGRLEPVMRQDARTAEVVSADPARLDIEQVGQAAPTRRDIEALRQELTAVARTEQTERLDALRADQEHIQQGGDPRETPSGTDYIAGRPRAERDSEAIIRDIDRQIEQARRPTEIDVDSPSFQVELQRRMRGDEPSVPRQDVPGLADQFARLNAAAKTSFQPENYRLADMEASFRADEQIAALRRPEEARIAEELSEAMEDLQVTARALGVEEDANAQMARFDELRDTADAYGRAVRAAAECGRRRSREARTGRREQKRRSKPSGPSRRSR